MSAATMQLPADPGVSGWEAILPRRRASAPLSGSQRADVLVIGAGFAGLSAARRVQQLEPKARIAVLEGSAVAQGPAGRNSGFMIDLPHDLSSSDYAGQAEQDRQQTALNRAAIRFAQDAQAEYGMPEEALRLSGKVNAAATDKGLAHNMAYAHHLEQLGEAYRLLDAKTMQELTGISYYRGGLWTPGTAILQPALYIRELARGLVTAGVALFEYSPVQALQRDGEGWRAQTPQGQVQAGKVILAVNGVLQQFGFYQQHLMHVFTYASMTRALTKEELSALGGEGCWSLTPADPMGSTLRRIEGQGGTRLVIRNRFTYDPTMEVSKQRLKTVGRDHLRTFQARFPQWDEQVMAYCWGGRLCLSLNNVSVIGELEPNLWAACCQNGLGTAKGTAAGIAAAEQALQASRSLLPHTLAEAAPQRLWPQPLMSVGANAYLRWKEWRAGREF